MIIILWPKLVIVDPSEYFIYFPKIRVSGMGGKRLTKKSTPFKSYLIFEVLIKEQHKLEASNWPLSKMAASWKLAKRLNFDRLSFWAELTYTPV